MIFYRFDILLIVSNWIWEHFKISLSTRNAISGCILWVLAVFEVFIKACSENNSRARLENEFGDGLRF